MTKVNAIFLFDNKFFMCIKFVNFFIENHSAKYRLIHNNMLQLIWNENYLPKSI